MVGAGSSCCRRSSTRGGRIAEICVFLIIKFRNCFKIVECCSYVHVEQVVRLLLLLLVGCFFLFLFRCRVSIASAPDVAGSSDLCRCRVQASHYLWLLRRDRHTVRFSFSNGTRGNPPGRTNGGGAQTVPISGTRWRKSRASSQGAQKSLAR